MAGESTTASTNSIRPPGSDDMRKLPEAEVETGIAQQPE